MASEEDPTVYGEEDLFEGEDDDESEDEDLTLATSNPPQQDDDDVEDDDIDDTSSSNLIPTELPSSAGQVTVAVAGVSDAATVTALQARGVIGSDSLPDPKRQRIEHVAIAAPVEEKKPLAVLEESRRLFQRLWTDEDEIELLQGFLDYSTQRGVSNSSHHHDTAAFYDQIRSKLQLDFNKNQLVEKLRRLKKKYRNVLSKINSGKDYAFKSPHDQATFEISRKIWSGAAGRVGPEEGGLEDEEANTNPKPNSIDHNNNGIDPNSSEKKGSRPRKRSRVVKIDDKHQSNQQSHPTATPTATSIPNLIEETVRSCLSPLFKELLHNSTNGHCGPRWFGWVAALNPMPFSFAHPGGLNFTDGDNMDEKWRQQQILELEVYSKRLELVQDQIKSTLEELRSMGS